MGGQHCEIPWKATVQYSSVPNGKKNREELEAQLRRAYAIPAIYDAIADKDKGNEVCAILAKDDLAVTDLGRLLEIGEDLYEYDTPPP